MRGLLWRTWWHWVRWPMPLWRLRRRATVALGGHRFSFVGVDSTPYLSWLQSVRLGRDEPLVTELLRAELRPGDTFLDVGGYVGGYALLAARLVGPEGRVVVLEPDPDSCRRLRANLAQNGAGHVEVVEGAVAGRSGTVRLLARRDSTSAVVAARPDARGAVPTTEVPAWTLDDLVRERELRPDVVLIDVEGGEAAALGDGAAEATIRASRAVVVELHLFAGVDPAAIDARFAAHGMRPTRLDERGPENHNVVYR